MAAVWQRLASGASWTSGRAPRPGTMPT